MYASSTYLLQGLGSAEVDQACLATREDSAIEVGQVTVQPAGLMQVSDSRRQMEHVVEDCLFRPNWKFAADRSKDEPLSVATQHRLQQFHDARNARCSFQRRLLSYARLSSQVQHARRAICCA